MSADLDLWLYLEKREEEIIAKRKELSEELEALREARASIEKRQKVKKATETRDKLTIKEMVRETLLDQSEGGTSDQIIHWINRRHGTEVARTSLSPQLSRLKADGEVELDEENGIWTLTHEGRATMRKILSGDMRTISTHARSQFQYDIRGGKRTK